MQWLITRLIFVPTLCWNVLLGRVLRLRHWWDRIDDHVVLGALPFASDVPKLREENVTAVVNTCVEYNGPLKAYEQAGIVQLHLPTTDFTPPVLANVEKGVAFIDEQVANGGTVYVHCKAGRARSATIVLCWLVHAKKMTPEQAQALLLEKRPHVNRRLADRQVVREFYARCRT